MEKDDEILHSVIVGGGIGAALAALLTKKDKGTGAMMLGALAGAAILASYKANKNARLTALPVLIEENNALYELHNDGTKKFIKQLPESSTHIPDNFMLD